MGVELQKPYSISEISKHPFAVVISLLIGLLLICVGGLFTIGSRCDTRIEELTDKADKDKTERIKMYESMIFYKQENERLQSEKSRSDSLIRDKTQPFVRKILEHEN